MEPMQILGLSVIVGVLLIFIWSHRDKDEP